MTDWLETLDRLRAARSASVIVTVASTRGSVPREAGTKMIVTATDVYGTIGGGHLEHKAIAIARGELGAGAAVGGTLRRFPLGASLGQCCGGLVNLLFEPVVQVRWVDALVEAQARGVDAVTIVAANADAATAKVVVTRERVDGTLGSHVDAPAVDLARAMLADGGPPRIATIAGCTLYLEPVRAVDFHVVLFGAGHVGRALVRTLAELPCRVTWVDAREGEFPADVPRGVTVVCTDAPEQEVDAAPPHAYFLVMTHSHALDEALAEQILRRGDYAYFGLIGSITKRRAFEKRIGRRGVAATRLATMTCPIGIAGIPGKEPAAIAVAVAAQLLQTRAARAAAAIDTTSSARRA